MNESLQSRRHPMRLLATLAIALSLVLQTGCAAVIATGAVVGATVSLGAAVVGTAVGAGVAAGGAVIDAVSSGDDDKNAKAGITSPATAAVTPAAAAPIVVTTPATAQPTPAPPAVEVVPVAAPAVEAPKNVY
jgi:hypothetical protein